MSTASKRALSVSKSKRLAYAAFALVLGLSAQFAAVVTPSVSAAPQLTSRSLTLSTSVASATSVTYTYGFTPATSSQIQGIKYQACTTPLGTCTAPTGLNINAGSEASRSGWSGATAFSRTQLVQTTVRQLLTSSALTELTQHPNQEPKPSAGTLKPTLQLLATALQVTTRSSFESILTARTTILSLA